MENNNLRLQFNEDFKTSLFTLFLLDERFTFKITPYLNENMFEKFVFRSLLNYLKNYIEDVNEVPSISDLENEIKGDKNLSQIEQSEVLNILDKINIKVKAHTENDKKFFKIKKQFTSFVRTEEMKKIIYSATENMEYKHVDENFIGGVIDKCQKLYHATLEDKEYDYLNFDNLRDRLTLSSGMVKTYLPHVDNYLHGGGGLDFGELFVIVGGPKIGKTTLLTWIGAQNILNGIDVLHVSLEVREKGLGLRYDSIFSDIPRSEFVNYDPKVLHKRITNRLIAEDTGRFKIKIFPTNTLSISGLEAYLKRLQITDRFFPKLVIVDYADLMEGGVYEDGYYRMENLYEELRRIAATFNCVIVTASQFNREGSRESGFVDGTFVAEAFSKIMVADIIITITRSLRDKQKEKAKLYLAHSRIGPDGKMWNVKFSLDKVYVGVLPEDEKSDNIGVNDGTNLEEILRRGLEKAE